MYTKRKLFSLTEVCALPRAILVTSVTEGEGSYVFTPFCLFVCLFDCLFVYRISQKVVDSDETWWTCWVCDKEELIQFW